MTISLLDAQTSLRPNADGLLMVTSQEVTDDLLADLRSERIASATVRAKEHMMVAQIPTSVVDIWLGEGRPFWKASAREIVSWLRKDGLEDFIATSKRV